MTVRRMSTRKRRRRSANPGGAFSLAFYSGRIFGNSRIGRDAGSRKWFLFPPSLSTRRKRAR